MSCGCALVEDAQGTARENKLHMKSSFAQGDYGSRIWRSVLKSAENTRQT